MAIQKPEWFRLDAAKFLSDRLVDAMSTLELGVCIRLLCRQWIDGTIPDDVALLARLSRLDDAAMAVAWPILSQFFPVIEPGKRANRFMWVERERVIGELERKSDDGARAARKRWDEVRSQRNASPNAGPNGSAMPEAMQDQTRPEQTRAEGNENSDRAPEGLTGYQYAAGLLEQLGQVPTPTVLPIVAKAIGLLAKGDGMSEAEATEEMKRRALEDRARGKSVNRFWFEDGRWRKDDNPSTKAATTDVDRILREQHEGAEQVFRERGMKA